MQHGMKSVLTYDMLTACFTAECKCGQYVTTGSATPLEAKRKINLHAGSSVSEPASLPTTYHPATCHKCGASLATLDATQKHNEWHARLDGAIQSLLDRRREINTTSNSVRHEAVITHPQYGAASVTCSCGYVTPKCQTVQNAIQEFREHRREQL